jgi:hypothetical protein
MNKSEIVVVASDRQGHDLRHPGGRARHDQRDRVARPRDASTQGAAGLDPAHRARALGTGRWRITRGELIRMRAFDADKNEMTRFLLQQLSA